MELILERSSLTRLFWVVAGFLALVMYVTGDQSDPTLVGVALVLGAVSLWPFYHWMAGHSQGLPIWPVYASINGVTYALPIVQTAESLRNYSAEQITVGALTMAGFIFVGTLIWMSMTAKAPRNPKQVLMIANEHAVGYMLLFLAAAILFEINRFIPALEALGNLYQVVRGVAQAMGTFSVFTLAYMFGKKLMNKQQTALFVAGLLALVVLNTSSLYLIGVVVIFALFFLGYSMGSGRIPWLWAIGAFVMLSLLHPGKSHMRAVYWSGEGPKLTITALPSFYAEWIQHGLEEVGGLAGVTQARLEKEQTDSLLERSGSMHMLLLVQAKTPSEVPFFNGLTYEHIPGMFVPRVLYEGKGTSHAANMMLSLNYGVLSMEGIGSTSIFWGLVPEAYANFGYVGVFMLAVFLGIYFSIMGRLSVGVPMTSLRFVLSLIIMAAATKADTMGVFLSSQFQSMVGISLAALVLMKRRPNPLAEGGDAVVEIGGQPKRSEDRLRGNQRSEARWRRAEGGVRQEARGMGHEVDGGQRSEIGDRNRAERTGGAAADRSPRRPNRLERSDSRAAGSPEGEIKSENGERLAADGGTVRTMPIKMPKRIASWMPRRVRAAVVAQQQAAAEGGDLKLETGVGEGEANGGDLRPEAGGQKHQQNRPRQLAVPYQNYRRYRG